MTAIYRDPFWGDLPVVGTLHHCVVTDGGWCGFDDDGDVVKVIPEDGSAPPDDHIFKFTGGKLVGVVLIEWECKTGERTCH